LAKDVGGLADVSDHKGTTDLRSRFACFGQAMDVRVVVGALADSLVENGWIGGDSRYGIGLDKVCQFAGSDKVATQQIQPDALAKRV
jgi:hypothetical protein